MNRTLLFLRLDFKTIKQYLTFKNMFILLVVFLVLGYSTDSPAAMIGIMMMYGALYGSYPFAVGEKNGIDTLYQSLPLTRRDVVAGRYLFVISLDIIVGVAVFLLSTIYSIVAGKAMGVEEILFTTLSCFGIYTLMQSFQIPLFFKLGYAKAKFLSYLPLAVFPAIVVGVAKVLDQDIWLPRVKQFAEAAVANLPITVAAIAMIWILIMIASYKISYHYYKKREF